jgi:4-hydroxy-4-methyl-2-oxoglutarate aldolase
MTQADPCTIGLRIYKKIHRPSETEMEGIRNASVGDVSDVMRGAGVIDPEISAVYSPMKRIFGPAITVDLSPGDGLLLRAAIDSAKPGDVIVANAHGVTARAILGGVIGMHMAHHGVVGLVVDGAVRDIAEFRALGLPVMARAVTPRSGSSPAGWGEVNVPIACGGAVVHPGDVVIGDEEGLVIVPRAWVASVAGGLGNAGHPAFAPETLQDRLKAMDAATPVLGIDRVHKAVAERMGAIFDAAYGDPGVR